MFSIRRKLSVTSLFHVRIGRSKTIRDFMKCFGVAILQLDTVSPDTVLQAVKQAIRLNTQFFDSLSQHPLTRCSSGETSSLCSRMTQPLRPKERLPIHLIPGTTTGIRESGVGMIGTEGINATPPNHPVFIGV